jgi:L-rhamnose mutarotase
MQRVAQTIRLRPELREEYLRLHLTLVWHLSEPAREP